jgi:hypothetical protein
MNLIKVQQLVEKIQTEQNDVVQAEPRNIFTRSNTGIVGSKTSRDTDACVLPVSVVS